MATAREEILERISKALEVKSPPLDKPDLEQPVYNMADDDPLVIFAENFKANGGKLYYSVEETEMVGQLDAYLLQNGYIDVRAWEKELLDLLNNHGIPVFGGDERLEKIEAGITYAEALVARTGSLLISSRQQAGRRLAIYPPTHIVVAYASQVVPDIADGLLLLRKKYINNFPSMVNLVSGASRTSDIEKTLVHGAHGPKELVLFLIDDIAL